MVGRSMMSIAPSVSRWYMAFSYGSSLFPRPGGPTLFAASLPDPVYAVALVLDPQGSRDEGTSPAASLQLESRVGKRIRKKASTVSFPDSLRSCVTEKEATLSKGESKAEPHHQRIIAYPLEDYTRSCHSNFLLFSQLYLSLSPHVITCGPVLLFTGESRR